MTTTTPYLPAKRTPLAWLRYTTARAAWDEADTDKLAVAALNDLARNYTKETVK